MKIEAKSGKGSFLIIKGSMTLVEINSTNWFSSRVVTKFKGNNIEIKAKNFWSTKFDIIKNGVSKGEIIYNWKGRISLEIDNISDGEDCRYQLRSRGILKRHFELLEEDDTIVLIMKPKLNWRKLGYNYEIETNKTFADEDEFLELLIYCGFSANMYMTKKAAKSAG